MPTAQNINNAMNANQSYLNLLQKAMNSASSANNNQILQVLYSAYLSAKNMQVELANLFTITSAQAAQSAVMTLNAQAQALNQQANMLQTVVEGIGIIASILAAIGAVVAAVGAL